eukprot:1509217-Heterocapsa_arctica.AAC.1
MQDIGFFKPPILCYLTTTARLFHGEFRKRPHAAWQVIVQAEVPEANCRWLILLSSSPPQGQGRTTLFL